MKSGKRTSQFIRFIKPIVEILKQSGGSGLSSEVTDNVIELMRIPETELSETLKNGESRIRNQVAWARMYLVNSGYIDSSVRGTWKLTDKGLSSVIDDQEVQEIVKKGSQASKPTVETKKEIIEEESDEDIESEHKHKSELLKILQSISPNGFERICRRLLTESGLEKVEITGKSGDGGIDGHGIILINPLVSFKVIFQCKRYQGSVTPSQVRDFRGAMQGRADKGIIMTTGRFTSDSKKEAIREGVPPIELVDGEKIIELFEKYNLGLKQKVVYDIDYDFFEHFK